MTGEGIYNIPPTWPNCTETVVCGSPPEPTVNGSRIWVQGEPDSVSIYFLKTKQLSAIERRCMDMFRRLLKAVLRISIMHMFILGDL